MKFEMTIILFPRDIISFLQRIIIVDKVHPIYIYIYIIYLLTKNTLSTFRVYLYKHNMYNLNGVQSEIFEEQFQILSIGEHNLLHRCDEILIFIESFEPRFSVEKID